MGQARLSVIDLSQGGHQPMHASDGVASIVFNGEIYNYRELRAELKALGRIFTSDSDTEVLLAAWQHWGKACLPRLVGMFAFVVFDRAQRTLTCVRDAFGIKPFFYTQEQGNFLFASEVKALLQHDAIRPEPNFAALDSYLTFKFVSGALCCPPSPTQSNNSAVSKKP